MRGNVLKRVSRLVIMLIMTLIMMFAVSLCAFSENGISVKKSGGWFEYAFVVWEKFEGASSYNVYYKKSNEAAFTKLEGEDAEYLIREKADGWHVDIPGLKGGENYDIKVVPVVNGEEKDEYSAVLSVKTLFTERIGYAFKDESGYTSGGYNKDGSIPENASIFYLTETTKGGLSSFLKNETPKIVRVLGEVDTSFNCTSNLTIEGIGDDAKMIKGISVRSSAENVEIRNLEFKKGYSGDGVGINGANRVFVHNNLFYEGNDGACDMTNAADNITFSYNKLVETKKSMLIGSSNSATSDAGHLTITLSHNYFKDASERCPRVRFGTVHVVNNYYDGNKIYCTASTCDAQVYVEGNYYYDCQRPHIVSKQGNALFPTNPDGTIDLDYYYNYFKLYNNDASLSEFENNGNLLTSSPKGGLKAINNYVDPTCLYYDEKLDVNEEGFTFNPSEIYSYTADTPKEAKENVLNYASVLDYDRIINAAEGGEDETNIEYSTEASSETTSETTEGESEASTEETTAVYYGDVNKDGFISFSDAEMVLKFVLNDDEMQSSGVLTEVMDVSGDGRVTAEDASMIVLKALNPLFKFKI